MIDFSKYTFRCSSLPALMTNSKTKSEILSETAKASLRELWVREVFGREKFDTSNKYTEKGIMCEPDSMDLIKRVTGKTYFKNNDRLENEFVNGTPDIILNGPPTDASKIIDVKTSWDLWTFAAVDRAAALKSYYYQLLGYMWLTNAPVSELIYCLVNTPDEIMNNELYKLSFRYPEMNESEEKAERFRRNYIFDDIPDELKLKSFIIEFDGNDIEILQERIVAARAYLATLTL